MYSKTFPCSRVGNITFNSSMYYQYNMYVPNLSKIVNSYEYSSFLEMTQVGYGFSLKLRANNCKQ